MTRPRPLITPHVCGWMQMIIIDGHLCPWKDISSQAPRKDKKKIQTKPTCHFQVGYIHNQRRIKIIYIYIYFVVIKTDLSQQRHLKWLKMHYIKTMRQPCWKNTIEPSQKIIIHHKWITNAITNHQRLTIKTIKKRFAVVCFWDMFH